jgi:YegS/Rv2252/BmrU family lipid kinase
VPPALLLVRNPRARHAPSEDALAAAAAPLVHAGWQVDIRSTLDGAHAVALARDAAARAVDVVAACGGDGTVNAVVNGIAGSASALAVVPAGTTDVWAREAGIPRTPAAALALLPHARRARVDVGRARTSGDERRFLLMCSAGLDAAVVQRVEGSRGKRLLGRGWYAAHGAAALARPHATPATIELDALRRELPLLQLVAGNTRLYGGVARITPHAVITDGLLDVCVLSGGGRAAAARLAWRLWRGSARRAGSGIEYVRAARVRIDAAAPLHVQLDGEYAGTTPLTIELEPSALDVLVAPGYRALLGD